MNPGIETVGAIEDREMATCCFCLSKTCAAARVMAAPEMFPCHGHHDDEDGG